MNTSQDADTHGGNEERSSAYAVVGVRFISVPRFEIECAVVFVPLFIECVQLAGQFVPKDQIALGILVQDHAEFFYRRIIDHKALEHRPRLGLRLE